MGSALIIVNDPNSITPATNEYLPIGGRAQVPASEAVVQVTGRVAGTFSLPAVRNVSAVGTTFTFRKNGGNGSQTVSSSSAAWVTGSGSDTISAGNTVNWLISTGGTAIYALRTVFQAASGHACYYVNRGGQTNSAGNTFYFTLAGGERDSTESLTKFRVRVAGVASNFQIYISANAATASSTARTRLNGGNGSASVTIGAGLTGLFEDSSNTDTLASGDDFNFQFVTGTGGNVTSQQIAVAITASSGTSNDLMGSNSTSTTNFSNTATNYAPITGRLFSTITTEAACQIPHGFACQIDRMRIYVGSNTGDGSEVFTLRVNGSNATNTVTVGAGLTGLFEDTTHTDTVTTTDLVSIGGVGSGTTGNVVVSWVGVREADVTVFIGGIGGPFAFPTSHYRNVVVGY